MQTSKTIGLKGKSIHHSGVAKILLCFLLTYANFHPAYSQNRVQLVVKDLSPIKHDSIFVAGNFNNWDSLSNPSYFFHRQQSGEWSLTLNLPDGEYMYKYTGGQWQTVEKSYSGLEMGNRMMSINRDTLIRDTVVSWRDTFLPGFMMLLSQAKDDTARLPIYNILAQVYSVSYDNLNFDSSFAYLAKSWNTLQSIKASSELKNWPGYKTWMLFTQELNANLLHSFGNYTKSLEMRLDNLKLASEMEDPAYKIDASINLIDEYSAMKDYHNVIERCKSILPDIWSNKRITNSDKTQSLASQNHWEVRIYDFLADAYFGLGQYDSAFTYARLLNHEGQRRGEVVSQASGALHLGQLFARRNEADSSISYFREAIRTAYMATAPHIIVLAEAGLARIMHQTGESDSAVYYGRQALDMVRDQSAMIASWGQNANNLVVDIAPFVAELYAGRRQFDSAYHILHYSESIRDSLFNLEKIRQFQNLNFNETLQKQKDEQQVREARQELSNKIRVIGLVSGLTALLIIAFVLYRGNRQKQKANLKLALQKSELEQTLRQLRDTQEQLIQAEKMASLGELTAGIAHEIQNPLNFVNNFAEINTELIEELRAEGLKEKGQRNETLIAELLTDISENEKKIRSHGQRADGIVKGMLQHSRSSSGQKEPTDINALCDEYLRLAYHGLRAKNKSFQAAYETHFDPAIGKIAIVPQDMGRVLLNLINNAFYAVQDKKSQSETYQPTVTITTKKRADAIEIIVADNGSGIPDSIREKIFQPFFTTKPTGQGTGLGLSLSYDIIKAHGGSLSVNSRMAGEARDQDTGTQFVIRLPLN